MMHTFFIIFANKKTETIMAVSKKILDLINLALLDGVMLRFPFPKEYDFHHLEITNTDGKVALKGYRDNENYNGETGCVVLGVDSTFAINALIYLHDNAGNLRYRIAQ